MNFWEMFTYSFNPSQSGWYFMWVILGLSGFSMGYLGLNTEMTSAQMANQAEQMAQRESQFKIKNINESAEQNGVKRKEDEPNENQNFQREGKQKEEQQDLEEEVQRILADKNYTERDPKEFAVRVNNETEMIEIINSKEKEVLETITAQDLMGVLSKLDSSSGILVNRKI